MKSVVFHSDGERMAPFVTDIQLGQQDPTIRNSHEMADRVAEPSITTETAIEGGLSCATNPFGLP